MDFAITYNLNPKLSKEVPNSSYVYIFCYRLFLKDGLIWTDMDKQYKPLMLAHGLSWIVTVRCTETVPTMKSVKE